MAKIIQNKFKSMPPDLNPISIDEILKSFAKCADLMANENLPIADLSKEKITQTVRYF